ncbi:MAG: hypothetical protein M1819_001576 [Sarea resinae]|nr:MAG: hypothetical protein M1819_001576 [Sarea resinae]
MKTAFISVFFAALAAAAPSGLTRTVGSEDSQSASGPDSGVILAKDTTPTTPTLKVRQESGISSLLEGGLTSDLPTLTSGLPSLTNILSGFTSDLPLVTGDLPKSWSSLKAELPSSLTNLFSGIQSGNSTGSLSSLLSDAGSSLTSKHSDTTQGLGGLGSLLSNASTSGMPSLSSLTGVLGKTISSASPSSSLGSSLSKVSENGISSILPSFSTILSNLKSTATSLKRRQLVSPTSGNGTSSTSSALKSAGSLAYATLPHIANGLNWSGNKLTSTYPSPSANMSSFAGNIAGKGLCAMGSGLGSASKNAPPLGSTIKGMMPSFNLSGLMDELKGQGSGTGSAGSAGTATAGDSAPTAVATATAIASEAAAPSGTTENASAASDAADAAASSSSSGTTTTGDDNDDETTPKIGTTVTSGFPGLNSTFSGSVPMISARA